MSYIIIPSRRRVQPLGPVRIDWNNPLTNGLIFAAPLSPNYRGDAVRGNLPTVTGAITTKGIGRFGVGPYFPASASYLDYPVIDSLLTTTTPVTIAWIENYTSGSTYNTPISFTASGSNNPFIVTRSATDAGWYDVFGRRGYTGIKANFGPVVNESTNVGMLASATGIHTSSYTNWLSWWNGSPVTAGTTGSNFSASTTTGFRLGEKLGGTELYKGGLGGVAIWARVLSNAEALEYYRNPYQLYQPDVRRIYFGTGATGTTTTTVAPTKGALSLAGYAPSIGQTANQAVAPTLAHATITGRAPEVSQTVVTAIAPTLAHATITGKQPGVGQTANQTIEPTLAHAAITGRAPAIEQDIGVAPTIGHLTATGKAPGVTQNVTSFIAPSKGALTVTGGQPTLEQTANQSIAPSKGVAYLAGYAPVVEIAGGSQILLPDKGALTLTGYAPEVSTGGELGGKPIRRRKRYLVKDRVYDDLDPADVIAAAKEAGVDLGDVREVTKQPMAQKSKPRRADDEGREYWLPQEFWGRAAARQREEATSPLGTEFLRALEAMQGPQGQMQQQMTARFALRQRQEAEAILLLMA